MHARVPAGLLKAISVAATAAAPLINTKQQQLPRGDPTQATTPVVLQLMNNPLHLFAAASNALILLWDTIADLVPVAELLPADSIMLDSAVPAASLAMALARAYAGRREFCAPVMYTVLTAALNFVHWQGLTTSTTGRWCTGMCMSCCCCA